METTKHTPSAQLDSIFGIGNTTTATSETEREKMDPISSDVLLRFQIGMTGVWYIICIAGICSNIFNLRTFAIMGLNDSVTVSFFCLAISDFHFCSVSLVEMMAFLFDVLQRVYRWHFYLPPLTPALYMLCVRKIFNTTTIMITTFLAVQRCLCVVMPFHVKGIFTRSRTIAFVVVVMSFSTTISALYMWRHRVVKGINKALNVSELQVYVPPGSEPYLFLMEVFIGTSLNLSCQIIVMICLLVMGVVLRKSAKFRQSATAQYPTREKTGRAATTQGNREGLQSKEKTKEGQALVQVSLVSAIFVITYLPYLGSGLTYALVPDYGIYQPFHNLFYLVHNVVFTMELLNSSVNFIVYYKCNTKFRKCFPFRIGKRQA